jgi:predicted house-cleaning NTP pyrophosphatase (Maf/HAM1 superfamily)
MIEGLGVALFEEIQGSDESAIVGLPLIALCQLLRKAGIEPLS